MHGIYTTLDGFEVWFRGEWQSTHRSRLSAQEAWKAFTNYLEHT